MTWDETRLKNPASNAVGQRYGVEVDQKPDSTRTQSRICKQLRLVQGVESLDGFQLKNDFAVYDDIRQIAGFEFDVALPDRQGNLFAEWNPGLGELMAQAVVVDRFKEPGSEAAVNAHRQPDNPIGEVFAMSESGVHAIDPDDVAVISAGLIEKA